MNSRRLKRIATTLVTLVALGLSAPTSAQATTLRDVGGHWARSQILSGVADGYIAGFPDGTFRPDQPITRAEFFSLITGALGLEPHPADSAPYAPWHWSVQLGILQAAVDGGLLNPTDYGNWIVPDVSITRREIVLVAVRALGREGLVGQHALTATDAAAYPGWLQDWAAEALAGGILHGYDDGSVGLDRTATRAEALVMVQRVRAQVLMTLSPSAAAADPGTQRVPAAGEPTWTTDRSAPNRPSFSDGDYTYALNRTLAAYTLIPVPGVAAWLNAVDEAGASLLYRLSGGSAKLVTSGQAPIVALAADDWGRLWFSRGTDVAVASDGGTQVRASLTERLAYGAFDENGVLWATGTSRLYRIDRGSVRSYAVDEDVLARVRHVAPAPDGSVWLLLRAPQAGRGVEAVRIRNGEIVAQTTVASGAGDLQAAVLSSRGDSRLIYVASPEPALIRFELETGAAARLVAPQSVRTGAHILPAPDGGALLRDRSGKYWKVGD